MEGEPMAFERITEDPAANDGRASIRDTGIPVGRILGWLSDGQSRRAILAAHPHLESEDIDAAFDFTRQQVRARQLPDFEFRGKQLSLMERSNFRAPDAVGEHLEMLIHREKTVRITAEEKAEIQDYLRLDHLLAMMKAVAKLHLMAPVG